MQELARKLWQRKAKEKGFDLGGNEEAGPGA